jgi:hypothetical protein
MKYNRYIGLKVHASIESFKKYFKKYSDLISDLYSLHRKGYKNRLLKYIENIESPLKNPPLDTFIKELEELIKRKPEILKLGGF